MRPPIVCQIPNPLPIRSSAEAFVSSNDVLSAIESTRARSSSCSTRAGTIRSRTCAPTRAVCGTPAAERSRSSAMHRSRWTMPSDFGPLTTATMVGVSTRALTRMLGGDQRRRPKRCSRERPGSDVAILNRIRAKTGSERSSSGRAVKLPLARATSTVGKVGRESAHAGCLMTGRVLPGSRNDGREADCLADGERQLRRRTPSPTLPTMSSTCRACWRAPGC